MALNNMFSTGFNSGFGTGGNFGGGNSSQTIKDTTKAPTKKEKYPGLTERQIENLEKATANLTGMAQKQEQQRLYQAMIQAIQAENYNDNRTATENERFMNSLSKTDSRECKFDQSACRQSALVDMVKEARHLRANTDEDTVMKMFMQEMELKGIDMGKLNDYLDKGDNTILYEAGLMEKPVSSKKWQNTAIGVGVGVGGIAGLDATLYGGGAASEWLGKKIYERPIDSSIQESRQIQRAGANLKDAEIAVKDAKADLKTAKKTGEGVEEAQKALETAEKDLEAAKGKKVVKVSDTAREYNIGEGITEGWTAESRGIQARSQANQIFKKTIAPALENSKTTVNVQEIINGLGEDIMELAKNDPDKERAYLDALEDLKKSYSDPKFAEYSMKDTQTLKSGLQGRTPQKYFKGKGGKYEITNELQELKGRLSSKLTNAIHTNLTKELGEDAGKLYGDYARLTQYADDMAKEATNAGFKGGFGKFTNSLVHSATDGTASKAGLVLNKGGSKVKNAANPKNRRNAIKKGASKIKTSTWLNGLKNTLVKAGANPEAVEKTIEVASKSKNIAGKTLTKVFGPLLDVVGEIALPLDATMSTKFIEDHADVYSTIPLLYEKQRWESGNPSDDFKGWTEKDRANIGLSADDIYNIITSDEFSDVDNKTSWGGDRLFNQFLGLTKNHSDNVKDYELIPKLGD